MPTTENIAWGSLFRHCHHFALIIFLVFIDDHVEALINRPSHTYDRHAASLRTGLIAHENVWSRPMSASKEVQLEGHANIYGTTANAASTASRQYLQRKLLPSHTHVGRQAERSTTSRQEVEALSTFKSGISGGDLAVLKSWRPNDTTACAWAGVVCSSNEQDSPVVELNLSGHSLVGNIASALNALNHLGFLQRLDLSNNVFMGPISGATLSNFSRLAYLNLSSNGIGGAIPFQIGMLLNLKTLDLSTNNLTGQIPLSIGNCTSLRRINLALNLLEGRIPQELGRLSQLQFLVLGSFPTVIDGGSTPPVRNTLSGSIPSTISNCSFLTYLNLDYNPALGGELPPQLSQLQHLQYVSLRRCSFTGTLPTWIGNLTGLTVLRLSANQFHGHIPDEFGQLRNLTSLVLGLNNLIGVIPPTLFNCTSLTRITMDTNSLSGIIPSQIGLLRKLEYLSLAANKFTGVIPSTLANCSLLYFLQLGYDRLVAPLSDPQVIPSWFSSLSNLLDVVLTNMNFYGNIPHDIGRLYKLEGLSLGMNNLTGPIPISLTNCTFLVDVELDTNNLAGQIPSEIDRLENMRHLWLFDNSLTGLFPPAIFNFTQLENLQIQNNFFRGEIGGQWGRLSKLQIYNFSGNQFSGPIPSTLSNCSNLFSIDLSHNNLIGKIPQSFGNLSRLEQLSLSSNQIGGIVPVELARCPRLGRLLLRANNLDGTGLFNTDGFFSLAYLDLSHNKISGIIPDSFRNFSHLLELDLSYNRLLGSLSQISMPALTSLNLSHNLFSGSWPHQWSDLEFIQKIDISANMFSGSISNGIFENLQNLVSLDLSSNKFSGPIPESLASISSLKIFNASYNNFEGPIPTFGAFQSNITGASFLGNPGLCGAILGPSRECLTDLQNSNGTCKFFSCKKIWIPVCVGVPLAITVVLVLTGLVLRMRVAARAQKNDSFDLFLTFGSHLSIEPTDILKIIQEGDDNVIGAGAKSVVYKGTIPGYDLVAIKTFAGYTSVDSTDAQTLEFWQRQLMQEASNQAKLRHRNILKIFSFCSHVKFRAMILEYMNQGSLQDQLYSEFADSGERTCNLP